MADDYADISPGTYVTRAIPFNGFGKVEVNYDPDMILPDGLAAPISILALRDTYEEGRFHVVYENPDPEPNPEPEDDAPTIIPPGGVNGRE